MQDLALVRTHRIDTVVTLVDALLGAASLDAHVEARRQAMLADRLVLTKTDLAPDSAALRARLGALNPGADILTATRGSIAPALLFAPAEADARAARFAALPPSPAPSPFARGTHTEDVESFSLVREEPIPGLALVLLLEALAEHCGPRLLRVKGLVRIAEAPDRPTVIHGVQHVFATPEFLHRWPGADRRTRIVFIAQGVPRHFPARLLAAIEAEVLDEQRAEGA
jgi:G3E family GTPase